MIPAGNLKIIMFSLATAIFIAGSSTYCFKAGYRLNVTASFPLGIYRVDNNKTIQKGQMILFCPPAHGEILTGVKRGYIGDGICPGGITPLQKRVVGISGDVITTNYLGVFINGSLQKNSIIYIKDHNGNPLIKYPGGTIKRDEMFVMSDYDSRSFDSRYFGPVPIKSIIGHIRPIFLF